MNTKSIHELTLRLCQALDQNYDVVNMDAVMFVISTLEGTTITKEQLETTRLAKFINHLRRRTKDEHLARRAKSLLKKWREMVGIQQQPPQVIDTNPMALSAAIPSGSGYNTNLPQQPKFRPQSISPAASSIHFDTIQHHSNSNSSQTIPASTITSGISERESRLTTVPNYSLAPLVSECDNTGTHHSNERFGICESQNEAHIRSKQPTSFENVLMGFGVTDRNMGITSDSSTFCHKLTKSGKQYVIPPDNTETFIIDQSSNSNSQMSLILPSNNQPSDLAPIVIDIQDSNSSSNLVAPVSNVAIISKISMCEPGRTQSVGLAGSLSISVLPSPSSLKSRKLKKVKKRKDKNEYSVHGTEVAGDAKDATVLLDETSSNQHRRLLSGEYSDKYSPFVNDEKSRLAYPEILSLLDDSSMSSMFPPESSPHPVDEQNKVDLSASNNIHTSFNLSTSDLTFAGKFKQSAIASSNDLSGYNAYRCTTLAKTTSDSNFQNLRAGPTTSKFTLFRDVRSNSNDSNSNSQASQPDLLDVINNDKMQAFQIQRKQETLNLQHKTASTSSMLQQTVATTITSPQRTKPMIKMETSGPGTSSVYISPEKKVPRKRGRKKGSKGVDSIIAKESSLSSQMIMTSLGTGSKKVKTTKELYAEMQNRKLGKTAALSSPTSTGLQVQQQLLVSRPTSSCSEPSLQSPHIFDACSTNATMSTVATRYTLENCSINANAGDGESTSETGTSDPSRDSSTIPKQLKRSLYIDSNSNTQQLPSMKANPNSIPSGNVQIAEIEKQLNEILSNLPPVQDVADIELKFTTETVPCTCKITEVSPPSNDLEESVKKEQSDLETLKKISDGKNFVLNVSSDQFVEKLAKLKTPVGNEATSDEIGSKQVPTSPLLPNPNRPKLKKSIFDFDFDDDEDPLHTLKAEAAATNSQKEKEPNNSIEEIEVPEVNASNVNQIEQQQHQSLEFKILIAPVLIQPTAGIVMPTYPTYDVEEDDECIAKQRFELQTQKITKFHIDALHNCFIPNVNGNWDDTNNRLAQSTVLVADAENGYVVTNGFNVVPKYGSLVTERIRKNLSHIQFSENLKLAKDTVAEKLQILPFLGVARSELTNNMEGNPHIYKTCHKTEVTAFKTCVCDKNHTEPSKFQANKKTEGYKTDEENIDFGVQIKDNQISTELLFNAVKDESKGPTNNYDQIFHRDSMLHLAKALAIEADSIVNKNNNNVTLKDISIDVVDHDNDIFLTQSNELGEAAGQNLLAIADNLDYDPKFTSLSQNSTITMSNNPEFQNNVEDLHQSSNAEIGQKESGSGCRPFCLPSPIKLLSKSNEKDTPQIAGENASSRRRSSCSNSSLKQTQHSINLKLKRQFREQTLLDINGERKHGHKKNSRRFPFHKFCEDTAGEENKQPKIKRIKIAINGNMAAQMEISGGNSNTNTDEENEEKSTEDAKFDEENKHTGLTENEDVEIVNSVGSRISTCNKHNEGAAYELCVSSRENCNDDQEIDCDDYGENDVDAEVGFDEYEGGEGYSGDYHEVVTRDISAPSTGNNHIVLTIKKTSSKTNSPSNFLSTMSPVIASNNANSSQEGGTTTIISRTSYNPNLDNTDKDAKIVRKIEAGETDTSAGALEATNNFWDRNANTSTTSFMQNVDDSLNVETSSRKQSFLWSRFKKYRKPRRRLEIKNTDKENGKCSRHVKLHHELFFPRELVISDCYGRKCSILNISSCSSSCGEDSEYEENNKSVSMTYISKKDSSDRTFSEVVVADTIDLYETQQHWKCDLSTSPCSTNSSFSTCGSVSKNYVQSKSFSNLFVRASECVDQIKKNEFVNKTSVENEANYDSSLTADIAYSDEKVCHALANGNVEDAVNVELPVENNGLLHSFNNIYVTVDKLESQTNDTTINNDNIVAIMAGGHMICDNKTVDPVTVDAEKQQELMLRNKNCDDCNNIYNNKNINNINLIRYYINEPTLVTQVNRNKQSSSRNEDDQHRKENHLDIGNVFNANTEADFINTTQKFANNDKNTNNSNVNYNSFIEHSADQITNISCTDRLKNLTQSSSCESRCVQVMLSHEENRTGLRAVDEDVDDDDGNNCARIQQFKEWHQVLQLRSYKDELLTVLPYVVLD